METNIIKSTIKEFQRRGEYLEKVYKINSGNIANRHSMLSEIQQIDKMIEVLKTIKN